MLKITLEITYTKRFHVKFKIVPYQRYFDKSFATYPSKRSHELHGQFVKERCLVPLGLSQARSVFYTASPSSQRLFLRVFRSIQTKLSSKKPVPNSLKEVLKPDSVSALAVTRGAFYRHQSCRQRLLWNISAAAVIRINTVRSIYVCFSFSTF